MLKLLKLQIYNFFIYKEVNLDFSKLDFNSVVFVEGINHDATDSSSNYSGKSTLIIDAFKWVIRGRYERLNRATDVVGPYDKRTFVRLVYNKDGNKLIITRYRNDPKFKNSLTVKWKGGTLTGERIVESQAALQHIIGMDVNRFIYGTFFDADSEFDLFKLKPAARNKALGFMWQLDELDEAAKVCSGKCSDIDKKMVQITNRLSSVDTIISEVKDTIKTYEYQIVNVNDDIALTILDLKNKIKDIKTMIKKNKTIGKKIEELKLKREAAIKQLKKIGKVRHAAELDRLQLAELKRTRREKFQTLEDAKIAAKAYDRKLRKYIKTPTSGRTKIFCMYCGVKLTPKTKAKIVKTMRSELVKMHKHRVVAAGELNRIDQESKVIKERLLSYDKDKTRELERKVGTRIFAIDERIASLNVIVASADKLESKIENYQKRIKQTKKLNSMFSIKIEEKKKTLQKYIEEKESLTEKKKELDNLFKVYKFWSGPKGFKVLRNLILNERVEIMSDEFARYLDAFSDGSITGEWNINKTNGDIECELVDATTGKKKHYAGFSSAQRAKISIAQNFALAKLCAPEIGHINIDELLDGALDDVGFHKIMNYLRNLDGFGKVIFLTSHRAGVQNIADAVLRVERRNSVASASLVD